MKHTPARAILEMWAYGCSGSVIAWALNLDGGFREVNRVVEQARSIRDPRAVIHAEGNTRKQKALLARRPDLAVVPVIRRQQGLRIVCGRGHRYDDGNTRFTKNGRRCRECSNLVRRVAWKHG